ncbi:MAG: hypothetical protein KA807_02640 [Prolixibacteraceae bacterium]|nr:hypothetical protein [Prolixibacteraceae bacterium]
METQKKSGKKLISVFVLLLAFITAKGIEHSNPNLSAEAKALLKLYYNISGKYTLTGQHNYPNSKDRNTRTARDFYGKTPVIWGSDFGFAKEGDKDAYTSRPEIVKEAIRQHHKGSIIHLCWHAVPPTADEPVVFRSYDNKKTGRLNSVQGRLTEEQYKDLLTPGTDIYNNWAKQVDTIAFYLKQLQEARVPVMWRPYHEMNGNWFWWGERIGKYSTKDIYIQLYDRLVNYHKLNNLIWVWNVDRPFGPIRNFSNYYPGDKYLDILSLDVYGSDFQQQFYDSLVSLSKGKPVLLGEVGQPPLPGILDKQPLWTSWTIWADMAKDVNDDHLSMIRNDARILSKEDTAFIRLAKPYWQTCNLTALPLEDKFTDVNFSGTWILNKEKNDKRSKSPFLLVVDRDNEILFVKKYTFSEYGEDHINYEDIYLDGKEIIVHNQNVTSDMKAFWDEKNQQLEIVINSTHQWEKVKNAETWKLDNDGKQLKIEHKAHDRSGKETIIETIYDKY